jgi:ADP-ribosylglycohydrolase
VEFVHGHKKEYSMCNRFTEILFGSAVGDSLRLPSEGLSPLRRNQMMPDPWRHRFFFGRGMISDDTEHAIFVAQSLLKHPNNPSAFQRSLAWHLPWWLLGLLAGIRLATLRACVNFG